MRISPPVKTMLRASVSRCILCLSAKGFTLLELLTVMGMLGIMVALVVPAFQVIVGARGVSQAVYDVVGLLELARSEAVARQTYVWVGLETATEGGSLELRMAAVASRDGSGTNLDKSNLFNLTKIIRVRNVALSTWQELKAPTRALISSTVSASVAANLDGISFTAGSTRFESGQTVTFTPRGESLMKGIVGIYDGYNSVVAVGIRQARGSIVSPTADDAAVLIDGPTGAVTTVRLQ